MILQTRNIYSVGSRRRTTLLSLRNTHLLVTYSNRYVRVAYDMCSKLPVSDQKVCFPLIAQTCKGEDLRSVLKCIDACRERKRSETCRFGTVRVRFGNATRCTANEVLQELNGEGE